MTPSAIDVYFKEEQEFIYVVDSSNCTVSKYTSGGEQKSVWGSKGSADNQLYAPGSIFITKDEDIYLADSGNDRIVKMSYWNMPENIKLPDNTVDKTKSNDKKSEDENSLNSTLTPQVDVKPDEQPSEKAEVNSKSVKDTDKKVETKKTTSTNKPANANNKGNTNVVPVPSAPIKNDGSFEDDFDDEEENNSNSFSAPSKPKFNPKNQESVNF